MATDAQVAALRRMIAEPDDCAPYTAGTLKDRIDAAGGELGALAGEIWTEKAGRFAGMVDVQEGSSSRSLSKLHAQALEMARQFGAGGADTGTRRPARTRAIERP